ncbi:MAG: transposase [Patescibacteria group bacterium]
MSLRFGKQHIGGIYHVFNRGTDKRIIFTDKPDKDRFLLLMKLMNSKENIGSMRDFLEGNRLQKEEELESSPLVRIIAFSLQGNHYHLLLEQIEENGVQLFMHKLGMAYAKYFNSRQQRTGTLYQGRYKYVVAESQHSVMRLIAYINRNEEMHKRKREEDYSSRKWYVSKEEYPMGLELYKDLFGDYEKQEEDIILQYKRQRDIDSKHDREIFLE